MKIGIDVDDTILNLLNFWVLHYNTDFHDNLKEEDITDWKIDKFVKEEAKEKIYNYIRHPQIFEECRPIKNALNSIKYLRSLGHRVIFVTANNPDNVKQRWLRKNEFWDNDENFIVASDKSLIDLDILIDDKYENCRDTSGVGILFTRPHNKKYDWFPRANGWEEVIDIVEGRI